MKNIPSFSLWAATAHPQREHQHHICTKRTVYSSPTTSIHTSTTSIVPPCFGHPASFSLSRHLPATENTVEATAACLPNVTIWSRVSRQTRHIVIREAVNSEPRRQSTLVWTRGQGQGTGERPLQGKSGKTLAKVTQGRFYVAIWCQEWLLRFPVALCWGKTLRWRKCWKKREDSGYLAAVVFHFINSSQPVAAEVVKFPSVTFLATVSLFVYAWITCCRWKNLVYYVVSFIVTVM